MKSFLILVILFVALTSFSQTVITGTVKEDNGDFLPGANVYLVGSFDGTSTNERGMFRFKSQRLGEQILKVEFMGYEPALLAIKLTGDSVNVSVKLKEAFNILNAVTITAGTFEAGDKRKAVTITPLDMMTTAGALGDVYGALQSLPGTTVNGESGRLFVKGGDSEESKTYIDGALVLVPYQSSAPNMATRGRFNPFMFKGTLFSTGGYSAEYGDALSSVLILNTNDMPAEEQLDLSFLSVGVEAAGTKKWNDGAVTATVAYNNLLPYMKLVPQAYDWKHYPESLNGAVSLRQKTAGSGMLKLYTNYDYGRFTVKRFDFAEEGPVDYQLTNGNYFATSSWNRLIGKKWGVQLAGSFTRSIDEVVYQDFNIDQLLSGGQLKAVFNYTCSDRVSVKFGTDYMARRASREVNFSGNVLSSAFRNNQLATFAEAQLYASSRFVARVGARLAWSDLLLGGNFSPRLSFAYKVSQKTQLSAAYGWFYQAPLDSILYYTHSLEQERADHYTLTFQSESDRRTLRFELYYKDYRDLVKYTGEPFYFPSGYNNSGKGYAAGLDLFWRDRKTIKNGDYWISYSYLDTQRDYRDFPEQAVPSFASKHNISVVYKHWIGEWRSMLGVNMKYASPRVYNDPNSTIFNGVKMSPYRSVDMSWSYLFRQNIIVYGAVTNVFGFKNEYGRRYSELPDSGGFYPSAPVVPESDRFYVLGCFITLTKGRSANQLDKIE